MSDLLKGINSIWLRLFNHRGFLNGEIQLILRELEQKRNNREVEELLETLEIITNVKDIQVDRVKQLVECMNAPARVDLVKALQTCSVIEELEARKSNSNLLIVNRRKVDEDWAHFSKDISEKSAAIDRECEQKEFELRQFYRELESKLKRDY